MLNALRRIRAHLLCLYVTFCVLLGSTVLEAQDPDQIARGADEYTEKCASCHQRNLRGNDVVPPLVGRAFIDNWEGETVWDLADYTDATMPLGSPGLRSRALSDVIVYILQRNANYPGDNQSLDITPDTQAIITAPPQ